MRVLPLAILLLSLSPATAQAEITFSPANGPHGEDAVLIRGAQGEMDGVGAEYDYLATHYGSWQRGNQSVMCKDGRTFDVFEPSKGGQKMGVYFDISLFFGKY
jgi:hypothetical protein